MQDRTRSQLRDEVTGLLLRGGLIGLLAFAAAIAFMAIPRQLGRIEPTVTIQTGPRGLGMNQPRFIADVEEQVAVNALPDPLGGPIPPTGGEELAGDANPLAGPLGHLTVPNFDRLVTAMRGWVGRGDLFAADTYATTVAWSMVNMTWAINQEWEAHVGPSGVTCYTCHRGNQVPANVWVLPEPNSRWAGPSARYQNVAIPANEGPAMVSNYSTALPVDALQAFLLEDSRQVGVHGYAPRDEDGISNASIYDTYQTYNLMMHFSSSLGVNCTYCHNTRAPADPQGYTPAWANAQLGRQMVLDINNTHILATQSLLPEARLGPAGDVPKVNCTTCHQGANKPLLGQPALAEWPELAGPDPVYQ